MYYSGFKLPYLWVLHLHLQKTNIDFNKENLPLGKHFSWSIYLSWAWWVWTLMATKECTCIMLGTCTWQTHKEETQKTFLLDGEVMEWDVKETNYQGKFIRYDWKNNDIIGQCIQLAIPSNMKGQAVMMLGIYLMSNTWQKRTSLMLECISLIQIKRSIFYHPPFKIRGERFVANREVTYGTLGPGLELHA